MFKMLLPKKEIEEIAREMIKNGEKIKQIPNHSETKFYISRDIDLVEPLDVVAVDNIKFFVGTEIA